MRIILREESNGFTRFTRTTLIHLVNCHFINYVITCSTNTMCVIFNILGHIIVKNEGYILDINTTSGNVSRDQNILLTVFNARQGVVTLILS